MHPATTVTLLQTAFLRMAAVSYYMPSDLERELKQQHIARSNMLITMILQMGNSHKV
jgi:hypothetical protein